MFFRNRNINLLNIHTGCIAFADSILNVFGVVYFLEKGFALTTVLLGWGCIHIFRLFLLRPFVLKIFRHIGVKKGVLIGTALFAGTFYVILEVTAVNWFFLFFFFYFALVDTFYWFSYHVYYAILGDAPHRGKEIAIRESLNTILTAIAPLVSGLLAARIGFWAVYTVGGAVALCAFIPLFFSDGDRPQRVTTFFNAMRTTSFRGFWLWLAWAFLYYFHQFIWVIVLFFTVRDYITFGGLVSLEIFLSVVIYLSIGRLVDEHKARSVMPMTFLLLSAVTIFRTFFAYTIPTIILSQLFMAIAMSFFRPPVLTVFYHEANRSDQRLWFQFFAEMGWDIGSMISLFVAALVVYWGFEIRSVMPLAIVGIGLATGLTQKYLHERS